MGTRQLDYVPSRTEPQCECEEHVCNRGDRYKHPPATDQATHQQPLTSPSGSLVEKLAHHRTEPPLFRPITAQRSVDF